MVYLDNLNVGGTFDQVMDVDGYVILFELYDVEWDMVIALLAFNVVMVSIHVLLIVLMENLLACTIDLMRYGWR